MDMGRDGCNSHKGHIMSVLMDKTNDIRHLLDTALEENQETGVYRCRRDIFTNPDLFELEMKHIFEGNWVYLAHESQLPNVNDYFTTYIGRQPVFLTRGKDGGLNAFINACAHRGAMLAVLPVLFMAGPSITPASCSRSRTRKTPNTPSSSIPKARTT